MSSLNEIWLSLGGIRFEWRKSRIFTVETADRRTVLYGKRERERGLGKRVKVTEAQHERNLIHGPGSSKEGRRNEFCMEIIVWFILNWQTKLHLFHLNVIKVIHWMRVMWSERMEWKGKWKEKNWKSERLIVRENFTFHEKDPFKGKGAVEFFSSERSLSFQFSFSGIFYSIISIRFILTHFIHSRWVIINIINSLTSESWFSPKMTTFWYQFMLHSFLEFFHRTRLELDSHFESSSPFNWVAF